jgi:FkbM family methyltransferase
MIQRIKSFIEVLRQSRHPLKIIAGQVLVKTGLHQFFTIRMNGYKINFSKSALAVTLFADSKERHEDEEFLQKVLKPGNVYADVGANIGTLALAAAVIVGNKGKVIAIEAHPRTFGHLKANVELNQFSNIVLVNSAVGSQQGNIFFSNINSDDQNKVLLQHKDGIEVPLDTLDHLLQAEAVIDLLKIDVEGYEKFVLQGAVSTFKRTNIVYFESWEKHFTGFGYDTAEVINIFRQNGFEVYKLNNDTLSPLSSTYKSVICENLVAVKDTRAFCTAYGYSVKSLN